MPSIKSERLEIERECVGLIHRLAQYSDHDERERAADLFTAGGTWIRAGTPYTGRDAILSSFKGPPEQILRHFVASTVVDIPDASHAQAVSYYLLYRHVPEEIANPAQPLPLGMPFSLGEWHDKFVKTEDGWRISHREVRRLFQLPAGPVSR